MLAQSLSFYQDEFAGRVSAKVMQTALSVRDTVLLFSEFMVFLVIFFLTSAAILGGLGFWLLLPLLVWLMLYICAARFFIPRFGAVAQAQADARSLMVGRITDAYANISTVKLFSYSDRESGYAKNAMKEFMRTVIQQMRLATTWDVANHTLSMFLVTSSGGVALWLWNTGQAGVGAVAAATAMALRLNGMAQTVMWQLAQLFEHIGTVQDGMTTLSKPHTVVDAPNAPALAISRGEVAFDDVVFHYDLDKPALMNHLSLHIKSGEKIGLVGRSGAGKSTIVNLLLRFYDVQSGSIKIDGQNIAQVAQDTLRAQIGMVTQDTSLLHRSVRDNLLYGRPDASEAEMVEAARRAHALEFIANLTDPQGRTGFDAHVGERGVKLSGGQRQRVAIARVMLKDAPILLLDEATSALDSEVEAAIQTSLYELMQGKTVIAIAHRLSTIAAMDRLIVLDKGQIIEQGSHAELLAQNGLYARLWAHQSGGFLGEE
jgi:ATP-binding cassette subfamily B multidrug efflux pump